MLDGDLYMNVDRSYSISQLYYLFRRVKMRNRALKRQREVPETSKIDERHQVASFLE